MTRTPRIVTVPPEHEVGYDDSWPPDDARSAAERLAEILNDPGPGIVITPRSPRNALDDEMLAESEIGAGAAAAGSPPAEAAIPAPQPRVVPHAAPSARPAAAFRPQRIARPSDSAPTDTTPEQDLRHLAPETRAKLAQIVDGNTRSADQAMARKTHPTTSNDPIAAAKEAIGLSTLRRDGELWSAIVASRDALIATGVFSLIINVLMLTGPLFMLQVYDRVMTSGSIPTLIALSALTALLYAGIGFLELVRSRVVVRLGLEFDRRVADRVFTSALKRGISGKVSSVSALRELDAIRQFVAGPGPITLFDAPWTVIYLAVIFLLHWSLGLAATFGAIILVVLTMMSERMTRQPLIDAGKATSRSLELAETGQRNAEAITAMGMLEAYRRRWQGANGEAMAWQVIAADRLGAISAMTKTMRLALQSMMLAIGAALALANEISAGTIVAATIIFGRALAPVEQVIGHWRTMLKALESYGKLDLLLRETPEPEHRTALPAPRGHLQVDSLRVAAPETRQLILANLTFAVQPGQMLAVIGPSASGKSTLVRTLVGLWPPFSGTVRLDGARLDQWSPDALGRHIGYLPQTVELFSGTVRDNICRFQPDARDEDIVAAAQMAHAHELILALPNGYETDVGANATYLSGGQRQRIALARALFSNPVLVILDEPNANLDRAGDEALSAAIDGMRKRGQAIVLVSHRVQAIGMADLLLYIDRGIQRAFGPRDEVMRMLQGQQAAASAPPQGRPPARGQTPAPGASPTSRPEGEPNR